MATQKIAGDKISFFQGADNEDNKAQTADLSCT